MTDMLGTQISLVRIWDRVRKTFEAQRLRWGSGPDPTPKVRILKP